MNSFSINISVKKHFEFTFFIAITVYWNWLFQLLMSRYLKLLIFWQKLLKIPSITCKEEQLPQEICLEGECVLSFSYLSGFSLPFLFSWLFYRFNFHILILTNYCYFLPWSFVEFSFWHASWCNARRGSDARIYRLLNNDSFVHGVFE